MKIKTFKKKIKKTPNRLKLVALKLKIKKKKRKGKHQNRLT